MKSPSVVVVGAGIVGCTVAYELARSGARVQVIETRTPGQGATRASAGILAPYIEGHSSDTLRSLGNRSLDLYDGFMARLRQDSGRDVFYRRNGTFELAFSDADVDRLDELSTTLARESIESRWVPPGGFGDLEPLASPAARGALLIPTHGFVGVTSLSGCGRGRGKTGGQRHGCDRRDSHLPDAGQSRRRPDIDHDVGSGSRRPRGRQLVFGDHRGRRRSHSRHTNPRTADSTANRSRRDQPRHVGA